MLDLPFRPDRSRAEPVHRQLEGFLRGLIDAGRLAERTKLPATRELAASLGLSRTTVSRAYDGLVASGALTAHVGQGTFVAARSRARSAEPTGAMPAGRGFAWSGLFALRARMLAPPPGALLPKGHPPVRFDFRGGQVATDALPVDEVRRAFSRAIARQLPALATHHDPFGWAPLRREIASYLVSRGIECRADDVAVVNGAQQAIDVAAHALLDPGDTVVMEQPGYFGAALAFTACQSNLVGVAVDEEGLECDALARVLQARRVKLVYTTPAAQCPTGVVMSEQRRRALLSLADEHQIPVLEDDYDSELRFRGPPVPALKTLDRAGQVIYAGTFSKVLFPALRIGFVVAARPLLEKMVLARASSDFSTAAVPQAALAALLRSGVLARHLRRMRRLYADRQRVMLEALARHMPDGCRWTAPPGGHTLWLRLPPAADPDRVFHDAVAEGIAYTRGELFHFDGRGSDCFDLSFANLPAPRIAEGVALLGAVVRRSAARERAGRATRQRGAEHAVVGRG
jgi:GntR family transcriptional regulator / MocR family aminotransferase